MEAWRRLLWLPLSSVLLLSPAAAASQQPQGCRRQCGNITVPYPFGIGAGCHRAATNAAGSGGRGFDLECDDAHTPPRLTVAGYGHEVSAISMPSSEATVLLNASRACYDRPGDAEDRSVSLQQQYPMALNGSAFLFSSAKNRFVSIGCPEHAYFVDGGGDYVAGCMSVCRPSGSAPLSGACRGNDGCCENNIPMGLDTYRPYLGSFGRRGGQQVNPEMTKTLLANYTGCSYAFMVDVMWFSLAGSSYNRTGDFTVPVVLDWAIRDAPSCAAARRDPAAYACRSAQSVCLESSNGPGYTCSCTAGYEGNPYVVNGCKDVDECERKDEFPCYGVCVNTPGSFTCTCPKGSTGNATIPDDCRPDDKFTLALKAVTGVSIGVFLLLVTCFSAHVWLQKKRLLRAKRRFFEQHGGLVLQQELGSLSSCVTFKIFSEEEMSKATDGFAEARVLGRGGQGVVYKGIFADGSTVAVKRSRVMEEKQVSEFAREMLILSQMNHRNVVKLLGCCLEVEAPILVYEYVPNGSLHGHIHTGDGVLPADARLRIAAEAADALAYIQSSASPPIIHRDVKTANILLDGELNAKVSDFGASRLAPVDGAAVATLVQGTLGYLDPEYLMTCQLTAKSDVYSFAVVVLELLTGRKAFAAEDDGEDGCLAFIFLAAAQAGRHREVMDSRVVAEVGVEVVDQAAELVVQCLSLNSKERPTMKEVASKLQTLTRSACSAAAKNAGTKTNGNGVALY